MSISAMTAVAWRRWVKLSSIALLMLVPPAIAAAAPQPDKPKVEVTVGVLNSLAEGVTFIAMDKGYFASEGLDVKLVKFHNTADMIAPLSSGQLDIASGAPTLGFFNAVLRGLPLKLVADKGRDSPGHGFNAIVVRSDLVSSGKVKSIADLKGLKVATPSRHSPMEIPLDTALKGAGLSLKDVRLEQLTFPNMIAAFSSKAIDAALMIEPFIDIAVRRKVGDRFLGFDQIEPNFQMAGVIYGPAFTKNKPDAAKRWMVGYIRGIRDYITMTESPAGKAKLAALLRKYTHSFQNLGDMQSIVFPGFDPNGYLNMKTIKDNIDWYAAHDLLEKKPQVADLVDYRFGCFPRRR
jgi:NitT/TauT family transport system substrate-binding protein